MINPLIIKNFGRFKEILTVFSEEGFHFLIQKAKLRKFLPFKKKFKRDSVPENLPVRLRKAFEKLGPTFIKLGQMLSLRPDLIPSEYALELKKLQDDVKPFPFSEVKKIVEKEVGPISKTFNSFSRKPVASASLAQVHTAYLKNGKKVAIKVQRPKIEETLKKDIEILMVLAKIIESRFEKYRPTKTVREFGDWTEKELNFRFEARNYDAFYKKMENVVFPEVYWDYTTKKVLVMEFIEGKKITEIKRNRKKYAIKLVETFIEMVYKNGMFHADLHPGNVRVVDGKLAILDLGMVGFVTDRTKDDLENWFLALLKRDFDLMADYMIDVSVKDFDSDIDTFKQKAISIASYSYDPILSHSEIKDSFFEMIDAAIESKIYPPGEVVLFIRAFSVMQGLAMELSPELNIQKELLPAVKKHVKKDYKKHFYHTFTNYKDLVEDLPLNINKIMRRIGEGEFKIQMEDKELASIEKILDRAGVNIATGFVIAGLLVTGGLTINLTIYNFPYITFLTFLVATIMILWMFYRMFNVRKIWKKVIK